VSKSIVTRRYRSEAGVSFYQTPEFAIGSPVGGRGREFISAAYPRGFGILASCTALAAAAMVTMTVGAGADPNVPAPPLPVFTSTPTDWAPNFAFPHNLRQNQVTDADITSEREMCDWFNAQFDALMDQINTFNANVAASRDDYPAPGIQKQADAVTANIDQSEDYLAPRAQASTRIEDCGGDDGCTIYYLIYEGEDFYRVWQQQSNISTSVKNHNSSGINNISIGLTNLYANDIRGSGCAHNTHFGTLLGQRWGGRRRSPHCRSRPAAG
jgi:hypothetical protein